MAPRGVVCIVALTALPALAFAQSLGEAARKEQERRAKRGAPTTKVLDDSELKTTRGQVANAGPGSGAAVQPIPVQPPSAGASPASRPVAATQASHEAKELQWRSEASRLRQQVARFEREVQQAERWSDPTYAGPDAPS